MSQHILIPVDRSPYSKKSFEYVLKNVSEPKILLLHVVDPVSAFEYSGEAYVDFEGYQQEEERRRNQAEQMLNEFRKESLEYGLEVETAIKIGKPAKRILETAEEHDIDHIVMGSRGRSGVGRVLLGSVAETVTRRSTVPVTIIR